MSDFSDRFIGCMTGKNLPAPVVQSGREAWELLHQLTTAMESAGFSPEGTLADLIIVGLARGTITVAFGDALTASAETLGEVLVIAFVAACLACIIASAELSEIRNLYRLMPPTQFLRFQIAQLGIDLSEEESASALG